MANKKKDKLEQWIAPAESISKNVKQTSGGTNVTYTYSQPKKTSGTRIVGTGGTVAHTDAGAKRVAELANKKNPVVDSMINSVSRGVGGLSTRKTTSTTKSNPASAFKPAPVMSKPKLTSSEKQKQNIDTLTKDLDDLKQKRMNIRMKSAEGSSFSGLGAGMGTGNSAQLSEIDKKIKQKSDKLKKAENKYYGYGNGFFSDNAKRVGRVISGAAQSVAGTSVETVGQIGQLGSQNPELTSTIGGMISEELNPGTLKERQQATQDRIQKMFETSDTLASKSAANIESAKGGLGALGKVAVDVGSEGLKMASDMALNTVAPGTGLAALGVRAFGAGAQEARQAGATPDQQFMYGTATAAIELFTERVSSASLPFKQAYGKAMGIGGKTFDDALDAVLGKFIKNPAVRVFAHNFVGEWIEEDMSDLLNPVAKLIYDKDAVRKTYGTSEGRQQLLEDLLRDGFIGGILGSLGATGDVAVNTALGNRLMKNGGAANVMATAASFPEQSEAHQSATEMIERHDNGGKVSAYEVGSLVQKMKEAAAHGVYPDDSVGTYEVVRDRQGNWEVVHQINETAQALNEKGIDTKEAIAYAAVLDSLAKDDNLTANQIKRKLDVFNPVVREQIEEMTGRVLPEPTTKSETARAIKAAFDSYRDEVAEAERIAEEERQAAVEAQVEEEEAAIAEESAAEAEEYLGQAVAETEQAQAEQQPARQPRESREAFFERKKAEGMNRYGVEPSDEQIESAWRAATEEDGVLLDDGTVIGRAEFYEVMRPYFSKEEGYELSDEQMEAAYNRFRAISDSRPMPRAAWNASVAATRGESASAETESAAAEETAAEEVTESAVETAEAAEETGATVMAAAEESAPAEEQAPAPEPKKTAKKSAKKTPARKTVIPTKAQAVAKSATTESAPTAEEEIPYAEQPNEPHRNPMSPFAEKNAEKVARNSEKQREEVAAAQKKQTQQKKTRQKKQTVIPTKAEAEEKKTATQNAETAEKAEATPVEEVFTSPKQYADSKRKETFGATIASYLKSKPVKAGVDHKRSRLILTTKGGPKYISFTGSELIPATDEMAKLASDTPDMGGVSAMPTGVSEAPTVEKLLTDEYQLVETAPQKITLPSGKVVYEFENSDGGKVYYYQDYFKVADGGILYIQKGAEHPALKSVNEDGTLRAFVMPTIAKGVQDGERTSSKLKSFTKAMQAKIQSASKTSGAEIEKQASKKPAKKSGNVKHSLSTQSKNPNIQTNERVTLEQRLAAEFLLPRLSKKGIKRIVFDGKNMEGENGHIDKKTGTIYLNENYLDTAMAVAQTVGHEIFHAGVEGDANLVNSMLESAKKLVDDGKLMGRDGRKAARWLKDIDAEVERRTADYREFLESTGADEATIAEETSPEAMREEIACDLMGMVLGSQNAIDTIAADNPTLLDKIVDAIDRLLGGRITAMANAATGGGDTSFARYGKEYASTVKELDKIAKRLSTALDNYRDGTRVVKPSELENSDARTLVEDMGDGTVVEADENGDLVFAQNKAEHSAAFSLATWQVGQAKLRRALEEEGHSKEEIDDIINRVDSIAEFIEDLGDEYAEMGYDKLKNNLIADIVTDVRTGKQVLSALVKNGDYPVNFDLALICKKRVAYMNLISRLVKDGVMDKVTFGAEAIAKVNEILRDRGFETACLGCFVESRRLQIQKWAETIVKEWNEEVDKRTKNAPNFGFAKGKNAELTVDDLAAIHQEYEGAELNEKGNKKLKNASVKNKMGQLLNTTPSLLQHLTVEDLLTPQGISALRQRDGSLFSLVQQRYGAASPKIVQDFNPYNGEIADLSFEFVKDRFGDGIKGKDAYIADAKAELAVEDGGLPTKQKGESKADFEKRKADFDARAENMAIRQYLYDIGGARIQSFSDFMIENVFDYVQIYADLAARKFPMHGYTKEIIALRLFGLTGQKWNGSLIAHTERSQGKELAGLLPVEEAKNGHGIVVTDPHTGKQYAICFDDYQRNKRTKGTDQESFIQSIGMKDIFALQLDSRYSPFVGSITIGVSDAQIRAMLNHPLFSMVIPYHKSGMLPLYAELVGVDMYNDYTDYQNTRVGAVYGKDGKPITRAVDLDGNPIPPKTVRGKKVDYAPGIYKKKDDGWTRVSASTHYDFNAKVQELGDAKAAAQAYVEWCYEDHPIYSGGDIVGYETFLPKFSDSPEGYDFTQEENYYKLLEDFVSYDTVTGEPVLQGDVQMIFPEADSLSADELDAYKQRLRDTGLYTEKEIERYAEKAQMGFKDIVREALDERKQYHDATDPQWEDTVSQVKDALLGDDHLRSTPTERQKAWKKEDKAAKKAEKQKGVKHSLNWERHPVNTQDRIPADVNDLQKEYEQATAEGNKDWQQQLVQQAALNSPYRTFAYHGSPVTDIDVFRTRSENEGKQRNQLLFGTHFTQRRPYAEIYTKKVKGSNGTNRMNYNSTGGKVYEVALDLGNSLDLTATEYVLPGSDLWNLYEDLPKNAKKKVPVREFSAYDTEQGLGEGKFFMPSYLELALQAMSPKAATDFLVAHNINSVIYDANYGAGGMVSNKLATDPSIIILDPERIKSLEPETRDGNGNVIPLTERFNPKEQRIRYSLPTDTKQMDEEYMAAVESGDTARAQEMVDEAARKAGYNSPKLYHGTNAFGFTVIDPKKLNDRTSFFATDSLKTAGSYSGTTEAREIADAGNTSTNGVYQIYGNTDGFLVLDAGGEESGHISLGEYARDYNDRMSTRSWNTHATAKQIAKYAKSAGYPGVIIRNVVDDATPESRRANPPSDVYVFLKAKRQVKSADTVVRDGDGKVIPLSERFNPKQSDIRYSLRNPSEENTAEYNGKPFWSGSASLADGTIEEVHSYEEAQNADFHHSLYFSEPQAEKIGSGDNVFFWVDDDGTVNTEWRNGSAPQHIVNAIQSQIQARSNTELPVYGDSADPADVAATTNDGRKYSVHVTDPDELRELNEAYENGDVVYTYKTFLEEVDEDGNVYLYSPMATRQRDANGNLRMSNALQPMVWEKTVGDPNSRNIKATTNKKGETTWHYDLIKDKGAGATLSPAYNPYQHSSDLVLNDQFEAAYNRPKLVTYLCAIPKSELTSGFHYEGKRADGQIVRAKDPVGKHEWKSGIVAGQLEKTGRSVFLSRWLMPVERVEDSEVARQYKEILDREDKTVYVPWNVVPPNLLTELEKIGVPINRAGSPGYLSHQSMDYLVKMREEAEQSGDQVAAESYARAIQKKEENAETNAKKASKKSSKSKKPVDAFTEKGRKYSVRGQVPEFDAIFDFYANYGLTNGAPKAPPAPQVSRVRSKTYERMGVPRSFDAEHRQALEEAEFEYDPVTEQESMRRAEERLTQDYDGEKKDLAKRNWRSGEDLDTAMGILATEMNIAKKTGDYDETIEWLHLIREQGTKAGQFVQAFAKYNRSPEGIVARAVDALEKTKMGQDERKELIQKIADFAATLAKLRPKADGSVDPNALVDLIVQQAKQRNTKVSKGSMKVLQRLVNEGDVQYLYNFALTQLDQIAKDYIPASLGRKVGTYQTISHLLNPKTGNRNFFSNTAFGPVAATANNVAMLPDAIFGLLTGNGRMVGLDRGHFSKETWRGIKESGARARLGINLDVQPDTNARDKYGTSKRTWKMTGNIVQRQLSRIEKLMAYELNWTDEFHKGGVRAEIIQSLAPMVAKGSITMEVAKEWAEQEALYRAFQDDTYVNKLLGNIKKLLNMKLVAEVDANGKKTYRLGQMDFGPGDIVQKYTQVPGALITRAVELSPAGYLKAIYLMGNMAKTSRASKQAQAAYEVAKETAAKSDKERLQRAADRAFQKSVKADVVAKTAQRDAALALGRAITGTGLIAAFAALSKMGLLKRADDEDDPDAKALNAAEGISGTQLNLSAIGRLIHGGSAKWQKGDILASVEFLEPLNNEMTMGSKIAQSIKGGKNDIGTFTLDTFDALYQSMQEIPTMQTLQTINQTIQYHKEDDPLPVWAEIPIEIARSGVTGFVPSLVRQTAQAMDPYYRDAYSSRDLGDQITSTVKNSIPGLREQLPVKLDNFGRPKAQENQPLNALNAFLIPGSVRAYQRSDTSQNLFDLYGQTGKANIFPDRSAPYNVSYSVDKQQTKFDLTPDERQKYQSMRGQTTLRTLINAMSDSWYKNASADQKVEITEKAKAYGNYKAKVEAAAAHGEVYSDSEYDHIDEALHLGYNMASYLTVKSQCNSFTADKDANGKSISGSKMNKIIDYLKSLNLTNQQKAYMFALTSGSNKTPFGSY